MTITDVYQQYTDEADNQRGPFPFKTVSIEGSDRLVPYGLLCDANGDLIDFATQTTLSAINTKIGEVQASPTANTLLARLKTIADSLAGTLTVNLPSGAATAAAQATGNASLATLAGAVSGTEMQVDVVTLPSITGSVTANAGTNLNTSALALESGGNLASAATSLASIDNIIANVNKTTSPNQCALIGAIEEADTGNVRGLTCSDGGSLYIEWGGVVPFDVNGGTAHDDIITGGQNRLLVIGGRASATAPANVSADNDAVLDWNLRNGAKAVAEALPPITSKRF
jgi:hypothetical protein